ncbi:MAG TPA: AraC family transcriptional regulator [Fimbriimonadaceae bacterium]|nr:AraC family transcriptional regulator [Fimbriimonadaceae bacterium]
MRCRYYHVPLDMPPTWGQVTGFGMDEPAFEWVQPGDWWQLMLIAFSGMLTVNGTPAPFDARSLLIVPPSARCRLDRTGGPSITQFWLKFRPHKDGQLKMALPQIRQLGDAYNLYEKQLSESFDLLPLTRVKTEVCGWNILWSVAENAAVVAEDPIVGRVEQIIKADLGRAITAESLAKEVGVSSAQLTRVVREHFGQAPAEYIRTLRMQQACILLINTDRPVKEIAARLGYSDLQRFNKAVREVFGCSPRALRERQPDLALYMRFTEEESHAQAIAKAKPPAHLKP